MELTRRRRRTADVPLPRLSLLPVSDDPAYPYEMELIGGPGREAVWAQLSEPPKVYQYSKVGRWDITDDGDLRERSVVIHRYVLVEVTYVGFRRRYRYLHQGVA